MTKNRLLDLLKKTTSFPTSSGKNSKNGSKGKFGNSKKLITPAQKHKGKGY